MIATLGNNGAYQYTVLSIEDVAHLPFFYLCQLAAAHRVVNPEAYFAKRPQDFAPVTILA